ncbi:MAG: hypothetical protein QW128_06980 [Thermoprotei archaeon]
MDHSKHEKKPYYATVVNTGLELYGLAGISFSCSLEDIRKLSSEKIRIHHVVELTENELLELGLKREDREE